MRLSLRRWVTEWKRAATTASSLKAEQDNGSGPRFNTFRSEEDSMKLMELMALCTKLFALGRSIEDLDANVEVPLVDKSQRRQDEDLMFDTGVIDSDEMFVDATTGKKEEQSTKVDAMEVSTAEPSGRGSTSRVGGYNKKNGLDQGSTTIAITEKWNEVQAKMEADMELAQRLQSKEQEQYTDEEKAKLFMELLEKKWKFFARKREIEKRNRPPTKAQQTNLMCTYLKNMDGWKLKSLKNKSYSEFQKLFDSGYEKGKYFCGYDYKDSGEKKVDEQVEDEKGDDQEEMKKHIEIVVEEEIAIDAIPLATKPLGIDRERLGKLLESWSQNSMVIQGLMMNMKVFCELVLLVIKIQLLSDYNCWKNYADRDEIKDISEKRYD
ncbi:hypothetical protein Tco_0261639 [Tanacetum coccineum]